MTKYLIQLRWHDGTTTLGTVNSTVVEAKNLITLQRTIKFKAMAKRVQSNQSFKDAIVTDFLDTTDQVLMVIGSDYYEEFEAHVAMAESKVIPRLYMALKYMLDTDKALT